MLLKFLLLQMYAIFAVYLEIEDSIKTTQNKKVSQSDSI